MPNPLGINAGRPEKYNPKMCKVARMAAECGWTDARIAEVLDIALSTLKEWKSKYPKFSAAIKAGRDHTPMSVVKALGMRAQGIKYTETTEVWEEEKKVVQFVLDPDNPDEPKSIEVVIPRHVVETKVVKKLIPPDVSAIKYVLNNRDSKHWREASHIDHTTDGKNLNAPALDLSRLTDEEIAFMAEIERKAGKEAAPDADL